MSSSTPSPEPTDASTPPSEPTPEVKRKGSRGAIIAVVIVVILIVAGVVVAYQEKWIGASKSSSGTCGPLTLQGDGAQFVSALVDAWAHEYNSATGNSVNYPASGSGTGYTHWSSNPPLIDFAITDYPLTTAQASSLHSPALTLPVIGGSLAIIYNVAGVASSTHLNLTGSVLAGIYMGNITNWNDSAITSINPGVHLPNETITAVHRSGTAGTSYVLTDFLSQDNSTWVKVVGGKSASPSWPSKPTQNGESSNAALLTYVNSTSGSIGYSDLTDFLTLDSAVMGDAAVKNPAGSYVVPTLANTESAITDKLGSMTKLPTSTGNWYNVSMVNANGTGDYPLATFAYMYVYQNTAAGYSPSQERAEVLLQWIDWLLTSGQTAASGPNLYYAALPAAIVTIDQAGVSTMTYNSAAVTSCS
jgi:phosphate transport system substrate-binding protein